MYNYAVCVFSLIQNTDVYCRYVNNKKKIAEGGIRTHEANARDLKTRPFDHSGIPAVV